MHQLILNLSLPSLLYERLRQRDAPRMRPWRLLCETLRESGSFNKDYVHLRIGITPLLCALCASAVR
ncbi:MAG: hypothetical protein ACYTX0_11155 [Nostoc sp.]